MRRIVTSVLTVGCTWWLVACADDEPDATPIAAVTTTTAPAASTTTTSVTGTTVPATVPAGVLAAIPFQNRPDAAVDRFQVKIVNGSDERVDVERLQLVWDGGTTDVVERDDVIVPGQRVDLPVPIPEADCVGSGTAADAPDANEAVVVVGLADGSARELPVYDTFGVLARLYLEDCERQLIDRSVGIEWAELRAAELEGRPVTEGVLRLTRRESTTPITVSSVRNTIIFGVQALTPDGTATVTLAPDQDVAELPVRFVEARCDSHAQSEVSTPVNFVVDLDLGDGVPRAVLVIPTDAERNAMRQRLAEGCEALGGITVLGESGG